jgi:radical SAM protein with 4Fe4S-binding SPASM domain
MRHYVSKVLGQFPWLIPFVAPVVKSVIKKLSLANRHPREIEESRELQTRLESRLLTLDVETCNICNANCGFCAYRFRSRPPKIMTTLDFAKILKRFVHYGGGSLSFTPLDRELLTKIRLAKSHNEINHVSFATNLIALGKHNTKDLITSGVDWIHVSTCVGNREMYHRVYGVDKYEVVYRNLVEILTVNKHLEAPVKIGVSLRAEKPYAKNVYATRDYQTIVRLLGHYISVIDDDFMNWTGLIKTIDLPSGNALRQSKIMAEPCEQFYNGLQVFANGDVGLCCCVDLDCKLIVGNLYDQTVESIWSGPEVKRLREMWLSGHIPEPCSQCSMYNPLSVFTALNKERILQSREE